MIASLPATLKNMTDYNLSVCCFQTNAKVKIQKNQQKLINVFRFFFQIAVFVLKDTEVKRIGENNQSPFLNVYFLKKYNWFDNLSFIFKKQKSKNSKKLVGIITNTPSSFLSSNSKLKKKERTFTKPIPSRSFSPSVSHLQQLVCHIIPQHPLISNRQQYTTQ